MNVLILIDSLQFGGAEKQAVTDANLLAQEGVNVTMGMFLHGPLADQLGPGIHTEVVSGSSYGKRIREVGKILRSRDIDLVHAHLLRAEISGALAGGLLGKPVILNEHGLGLWRGISHRVAIKLSSMVARQVWCASEACRQFRSSREKIASRKLRTVWNSFTPWTLDTKASSRLRTSILSDLGYEGEDPVIIGFVGRFDEVKRLPLLLEAAEHFRRKNVLFVLVGDGKERAELDTRIEEKGLKGRVYCPGFVDNPRDYYGLFDIFVLPSKRESMSVALLEAGSAGLPSIVFDVGGNSEIVEDNVTGVVVQDNDMDSFLRAMHGLISDKEKRDRMGKAAGLRITSRFTEKNRKEVLLDTYTQLLSSKGTGRMNIRKHVALRMGLPLFDLSKGLTVKSKFRTLQATMEKGRQGVLEMQNKKLRQLMDHAYYHVPFYRRLFNTAGLLPGDIRSAADLKKLPPVTRADLQRYYEDMQTVNMDMDSCYHGSSSGSTGHPVHYIKDRNCSSWGHAAGFFGWTLSGWDFGTPYLTIWGNPANVTRDWSRLSSRLKSRIMGETKIAAYKLRDREHMDRLACVLRKGKFLYIQGYTSAIHAFAQYLKKEGRSVPRVKGVLTTAESLQPFQRRDIEEMLGPVFDFYGCGEINAIGYQCSRGQGYHIMDPHVVVECGEVVDDLGNRELFITDLDNYAMPLIRYANGDAGKCTDQQCECGLPLGMLESVSGRTADIIHTPDGGVLAVPSFMGSRLLKELNGIDRYQVEIVDHDALVVKVQANGAFNRAQEEKLASALDEYIPGNMRWSIEAVPLIEADVTGKFKIVVDKRK